MHQLITMLKDSLPTMDGLEVPEVEDSIARLQELANQVVSVETADIPDDDMEQEVEK